MKVDDFDFYLPKRLIAQNHAEKRDMSRLLVYHRLSKKVEHRRFSDIMEYFNAGDSIVLNDTKVIPARIYGKKRTGADIELLFVHEKSPRSWEAMARPAKRLREGTEVIVGDTVLVIAGRLDWGGVEVRFPEVTDVSRFLEKWCNMPVPPYIFNDDQEYLRKRYQTVYARNEGSVAAPTAGLHFTEDILAGLSDKGVLVDYLTLHVGMGTFLPVKTDSVEEHRMHSEFYELSDDVAERINNRKGRLFACGTTVTRTLEHIATEKGKLTGDRGWSDIFIYPGYEYKVVDNLITNFHLPKSTLIMLVAALTGKDEILKVYKEAVENEYRFFSFGDSMLILGD